MTFKAPRTHYWAKDTAENLVKHLIARRDDFWDILVNSNIVNAAYKTWRIYHGHHFDSEGGSIVAGGEDGDIDQVAVNEERSYLSQLLTLTTSADLDWDAQAQSSAQEALEAAAFANDLLDYCEDAPEYMVAEARKRAAEEALVYRVGYVATVWDDTIGEEVGIRDRARKLLEYRGGLRLFNLNLFDAIWDPAVKLHRARKWVLFRERKNKWDLAEVYFDQREEILRARSSKDTSQDRIQDFYGLDWGLEITEVDSDMVDEWTFIHLPTRALPEGRKLCFVGDKTVLYDQPCPRWCRRRLPVHRIVHSEMLGTALIGHSPAVDLGPLQEGLNRDISSVLTNHRKYGQQKMWAQDGQGIVLAELEPGSDLVRCNVKPEVLDLLRTSPELLQFPKDLINLMGQMTGISEVSRGVVGRETSGIAMAFQDAKTLQNNSRFDGNYRQFSVDIAQSVVEIFQSELKDPMQVPIVSEGEIREMKSFTGEALLPVTRVLVKQGSGLRSTGERLHTAELLLQIPGAISNPKELLTVMQTGRLDRLTKPEDAQRSLCADENRRLRAGEIVPVNWIDDHLYHMKNHTADLLGNVEVRMDPVRAKPALMHLLMHLEQVVKNPMAQGAMIALGWATPEQVAALAQVPLPDMGGMEGQSPSVNQPEQLPGAPAGPSLAGETPQGTPNAQAIMEDAQAHLESEAGEAQGRQAESLAAA